MVNECIAEELKKTKATLEAKMQAQIEAEQIKAETTHVIPRIQALEEEQRKLVTAEKEAYDAKITELTNNYNIAIAGITQSYDMTKRAYREKISETVKDAITKEFQSVIDLLNA